MPQGDRRGLANALFGRGEGHGIIGNAFRATPIGQLLTGGGFRGAFNATPIGMTIAALRGGDPIGPNNSRAWFNATGMGPPESLAGAGDGNAFSGATASGEGRAMPGMTVTAPAPGYSGAASSRGAWNGEAGGLGRLMFSTNPWKQSGDTYFGARQGAF